jgi:digeranylgeranylglycerophospholipid reductase
VYDAIVVGAGPAGGMAARQIAKAGFSTLILDKKRVVGEPVQCAEGVSRFGLESNGIQARDEWVCQPVRGATCIVPDGTDFSITDRPGYAIDRPRFDRWLVADAVVRGADLRLATRVTGIERPDGVWRIRAGADSFDGRAVIAADGPTSLLAKLLGLVAHQEIIRAYEYRFPRDGIPVPDPDRFLLYIAQRYDGGYAWIFPKGDSVNVGAGGHIDAHAATVAFCKDQGIDVNLRQATIAGTIPYRYELRSHALPGFAVVGDAAGVTNPMNGAGIHSGLFSGRLAGEFAVASLEAEDLSAMTGYDQALRQSPFLDPLLPWMIERVRTWDDELMNVVGRELHEYGWKGLTFGRALRAILRRPSLSLHAREFLRMIRALDLCESYGW